MDISSLWNCIWLCEIVVGWVDIALHEIYNAKLADECFDPSVVLTPQIYCCRVFEFFRLIRWLHLLEASVTLFCSP